MCKVATHGLWTERAAEEHPHPQSLSPSRTQEVNSLVLWEPTSLTRAGAADDSLSRNSAENLPELCSVLRKQQRSAAEGREGVQGLVPE